jgi:hypothetical protein
MKLSVVALVVSLAALTVGVFAIVRDGSSDQHRCGTYRANVVACVSDDTPSHFKERQCMPYLSTGRVVKWVCRKSLDEVAH